MSRLHVTRSPDGVALGTRVACEMVLRRHHHAVHASYGSVAALALCARLGIKPCATCFKAAGWTTDPTVVDHEKVTA